MVVTTANLDRNQLSQGMNITDSAFNGQKFVVADDSPKHRALLKNILESLGMKCVGEAANGLECLNIVNRVSPDLVCLDVLMPVMHGVETLMYLREQGFHGLIIFVTQLPSTEALAEIKVKSYQPDAIFSKLDGRDLYASILKDMLNNDEPPLAVDTSTPEDLGNTG